MFQFFHKSSRNLRAKGAVTFATPLQWGANLETSTSIGMPAPGSNNIPFWQSTITNREVKVRMDPMKTKIAIRLTSNDHSLKDFFKGLTSWSPSHQKSTDLNFALAYCFSLRRSLRSREKKTPGGGENILANCSCCLTIISMTNN